MLYFSTTHLFPHPLNELNRKSLKSFAELIDIKDNESVDDRLLTIHKSIKTSSVYFKRIRTIDLNVNDERLGKGVWFLIGFVHTPASGEFDGYGSQMLFCYSSNVILIHRILVDSEAWGRISGTAVN